MSVTIQDVARAAGVTVGTVSRALNNYADVNENTRRRIIDTARRLGYHPNLVARSLSSKHVRNIALILSGFLEDKMFNHFETMLMKGCYQFALERGVDLSMHIINSQIQREKSFEQLCHEHNLSGAVLLGLKTTDPYAEGFPANSPPCVTIDTQVKGPNVSNVTLDHIAAFDELTQYLIDQGHRRIVLVHGRKEAMVSMERLAGAYQAMERNGLTLRRDQIIYTDFLREDAYAGVLDYFKTHDPADATAFLCMSDMLAIGVIEALKHLGYAVPRDYSVVGYDGLDVTEFTDPRITTIDQNVQQKGYEAARLLMDMLEGRRPTQRLVLPHILAIKDSVAPPSH